MYSRRDFFRQFTGHKDVLSNDTREVKKIQLNRLKELPDNIIDEIEPIFFPETEWKKSGNSILLTDKNWDQKKIELTPEEEMAFVLFTRNIRLKEVTIQLEDNFKISFKESRQICTSLFFRLAMFRICHPKEVYDINKLTKKSN